MLVVALIMLLAVLAVVEMVSAAYSLGSPASVGQFEQCTGASALCFFSPSPFSAVL